MLGYYILKTIRVKIWTLFDSQLFVRWQTQCTSHGVLIRDPTYCFISDLLSSSIKGITLNSLATIGSVGIFDLGFTSNLTLFFLRLTSGPPYFLDFFLPPLN